MAWYRGVNLGGFGVVTPQILGRGSGSRKGVVGGRGRGVKYYYILSCKEICSKVVRNRIIYPEEAVIGQFLPEKSIFW